MIFERSVASGMPEDLLGMICTVRLADEEAPLSRMPTLVIS